MSGAEMDYDFGPKRNWRRWAWNRLSELSVRKNDGLVLYLPGREDWDRKIAIEKGFLHQNLVAVENNSAVVQSLRQSGVLVAPGFIFDVALALMAKGRFVSAICADLTHGLTIKDIARINDIFFHPLSERMALCINFLRGRDVEINKYRRWFKPVFDSLHIKSIEQSGEFNEKHRGMQFVLGWSFRWSEGAQNEDQRIQRQRELIFASSVHFYSYRSKSNQTFDSVAMRNPLRSTDHAEYECEYNKLLRESVSPKTQSSLSAVLAHRTMRMRA